MNFGIGNVKGKSSGGVSGGNVWHTWTQANFVDGEATFSIGNIIKPNDIPLSVADKILYVDESDKIIECYMIDTIGDISVILVKIGEFSSGGGKQLYQHIVNVYRSDGNYTYLYMDVFIITDNNTPFTWDTFTKWLFDNGYKMANGLYYRNVKGSYASTNAQLCLGVFAISEGGAIQCETFKINNSVGTIAVTGNLSKNYYGVGDTVTVL